MSKKKRVRIKEARFAVDFADPKETLYYKLFLRRARLLDAEDAIQQVNKSRKGTSTNKEKTQPPPATKRKRSALSYPAGDNLRAFEHIDEHGLDHGELSELLYGEDTEENRGRVSSRIQFWRKKGWYIKHKDGSYEIVTTFLEAAREAASEEDED